MQALTEPCIRFENVIDAATDGHNDLLILIRHVYGNHIYSSTSTFQHAFENGGMPGHVDVPRLQKGKVGGSFWSAFVPCPANGSDFSDENYAPCKLLRGALFASCATIYDFVIPTSHRGCCLVESKPSGWAPER